jgi:hypothetical protein
MTNYCCKDKRFKQRCCFGYAKLTLDGIALLTLALLMIFVKFFSAIGSLQIRMGNCAINSWLPKKEAVTNNNFGNIGIGTLVRSKGSFLRGIVKVFWKREVDGGKLKV